ncbi:hypothetical protein D1159_00140 [Pseudoflavonifractor sp. 524-17]|uniref:hypothetical protein n=1 Tax=Pseudoflavonifractor sp. 524-17 TaxID=2304577 RepID=UPI00137B1BB9|nr:hypothetical protein [Pseudoflavonifractor sp. 524-17]NCE63021.1 hypothetical protein [Pseudoflavonifractor sp. 524-17]
MEEEKRLDMAGVAEDAADAERAEEEAKKEQETGSYTHTFKKPFRWKERTFDSLTFDWTTLKGRDHLEIEQEVLMKGRTLVSPAFTGEFLAGMTARACTERDEKAKRVIDTQAVMEMDMVDFQAITRKARGFLLRAE